MPRGSQLLLRVCPSHFHAVGEYRYYLYRYYLYRYCLYRYCLYQYYLYRYYLYLEVRLWREIASPRGHKGLHALAPSSRIIRDSSRLLSARRG